LSSATDFKVIAEILMCIFGDLSNPKSSSKVYKKIKTVCPEIRTITKRKNKVAPGAWIDPKKKYGYQYYYNESMTTMSPL
jgi:hypothetical protein